MSPSDSELETPWLRARLVEWLVKQSDERWQAENWQGEGRSDWAFDDVLDFFDDTGVLVEPDGRIGHMLVDKQEAAAMRSLRSSVDAVISSASSSDAGMLRLPEWPRVVQSARELLSVLSRA